MSDREELKCCLKQAKQLCAGVSLYPRLLCYEYNNNKVPVTITYWRLGRELRYGMSFEYSVPYLHVPSVAGSGLASKVKRRIYPYSIPECLGLLQIRTLTRTTGLFHHPGHL